LDACLWEVAVDGDGRSLGLEGKSFSGDEKEGKKAEARHLKTKAFR
jgi:hypothetical protein